MNDLSKDHFDCPHCGVKNVTYERIAAGSETHVTKLEGDTPWIAHLWVHHIIKCRREECGKMSYVKVSEQFQLPGLGWREMEKREVEIQYPSNNVELPDYIPEKIRKYYKEARVAFSFGLLGAASVMCRKVIYEICDKQKSEGKDYKEKIVNLGFDKRITDPLLGIKNIGDETVHANGWDSETISKALDALGIIIDMIYTQEHRIKDFTKQYTKTNQERTKESN